MKIIFVVATWLSFVCFSQEQIINLEYWSLKRAIPSGHHLPNPVMQIKAPSVVHLDLVQHYLVEDFYQNTNELSSEVIGLEWGNWLYETSFEIDSSQVNLNHELVFEGLDTYAKIYLNDDFLLETNNMFRTWIIPLDETKLLKENHLKIVFTSPLLYHEEKINQSPYKLPSGNEAVELQVSAYTRKAAYQFGWDWGPRFVTSGIWKPCYIRSWSKFRIENFFAETIDISGNSAAMKFSLDIISDSTYKDPFILEMMGFEIQKYLTQGKNTITFYHHIEDPKLWYPNGYGEQHIYSSTIYLLDQNLNRVTKSNVNFAIRKVELINEKDSIGTSFYFKINDVPVFAKGANYIPQDVFLPRVTNEKTEQLLTLVQEANMNMLRVWGGGIYESDYFYQQCDLRGIMIWQDFMFANSLYPSDSSFHQNILSEIEDNVKRLRNHPCIVLWCGNNEIEVAWNNWGWQKQFDYSSADSTEIWNNYLTIFKKIIPAKLKEIDSSRPYISSSPQSNWGKPENFNHGAMHYWGVWHGEEPLENFKTNVGRFMVEYGFQSYPSYELLKEYISEELLHFDSLAFKNRQKSYKGNRLIDTEIEKLVGDNDLNLQSWIEMSQVVQANALKTAIIAHRFNAPHCMGTLFWQLNDCWPGASWSVLDYHLNKKIAYHEVKKWFSPAIAICEIKNEMIQFRIHSDQFFEGEMRISFVNHNVQETFKRIEEKFSLKALQSKTVFTIPLKKLKNKARLNLNFVIEIFDLNDYCVFTHSVSLSELLNSR